MKLLRAAIAAIAAGLGSALLIASAAADQLPFVATSMKQIERERAGERFVAVLWSTDCAPCRTELALLSELQQTAPELDIVLIATDHADDEALVRDVLDGYRFVAVESWIFSDRNAEKLRYTVDPEWFGEMPRAYLYETDSSRRGISGALSEDLLLEWLAASSASGQ